MKAMKLQGIVPVLAAPFDDAGNVNYHDLRRVIEFQIRKGAHGIALFGFATEFYKLSDDERLRMLRTAVEGVQGRIPIVASITEQSTDLAVMKATEMERNGADALMVLPPFLIPMGKEAFVNHVQAIAEAVELPIMVQYSPQETGVAIESKVLAELMAARSNLEYLKIECKPPGPMISDLLKASRSPVEIFVGYAGLQMIDALRRGAVGVMPGSSLTDLYCRIYDAYRQNKLEEAISLHNRLLPLLNVIFQSIEMIIAWEKIILKRRGIISSDYCRKPTYQPDQSAFELFEIYYEQLEEELD